MKNYVVLDEKGGQFHTPANDENDAIERYWEMVQSCVGHVKRLCTCFNDKEIPIDRSEYKQPVKVIEYVDALPMAKAKGIPLALQLERFASESGAVQH